VFGMDIQRSVVDRALLLDSINEELSDECLKECDIVIIALYPGETIRFFKEKGNLFSKGTIVVDSCGVKQNICQQIQPIAKELELHFVGGHPMAGIEFSGFEYSRESLFKGASMILTPPGDMDINVTFKLKNFFLEIGFGHVEITTPCNHDKIIAYTSQLAHIVSNAYVKSPSASKHKGFSAGSYLDLTRVARLNPHMWTELFLENKEFLADEIDGLIFRLQSYRDAIKDERSKELFKLLDEGTKRKVMIDG
ncbi:MAG TPA: prephenate dehydrogenase/arogenate dehydrogenase family protein, partial [Anaerovoracaceae bacterium]|nr:prephenate dehydrogenase/arogenate dehydrogenase family protein [Anaerovoracaceae bacterium]